MTVNRRGLRMSLALVAAMAIAGVALAQYPFYGGYDGSYRPLPNIKYDGRFTFVRVRYDPAPGGYWPGRRPSWIHGYPLAERNLMKIMNEISFMGAHDDDINTVTLGSGRAAASVRSIRPTRPTSSA